MQFIMILKDDNMSDLGYTQYKKNFVRHNAIKYAVSMLTTQRQNATCVHRDYVRKVYDYFTQTEDESRNKIEASKIHHSYILDWEHLHDSFCQPKSPDELSICYLCGPEPNNDFEEFVALGVLPQNIWAFETDRKTYEKALSVYETESYRQPRIIKQNIETFFQQTPKKFDIIYIDACGSIPSSQHALRCISTIFQFHRLVSPGIVISNFAAPDDKNDYLPLLGQYFYSKKNSPYSFSDAGELISPEYIKLVEQISCDFSLYYGDFISLVLRDIPSIYIPLQRMFKNPLLSQIVKIPGETQLSNEDINCISDSTARFFLAYERQRTHISKIDTFNGEIGDYSALIAFLKQLKGGKLEYSPSLKSIDQFFNDRAKAYQFLDRPHSNILLDVLINQLAYPFHSNTKRNLRYSYTAKSTQMYTDVSVYDECRYIYDWLPAVDQIEKALFDYSYQYVFRFAIDGLVKTRQLYNNEFFFQGSVVSDEVSGFLPHQLANRLEI